jgi:YHS domain-containing protein
MAFIFADLIVLPIVLAYRKYYGTAFALRITALMFTTMVLAALVVDLVFSGLGLIPDARPTTDDVFGSIEVDYKLVLNVFATLVFVALIGLTMRRGAIDPVCGMSVDRATALRLDHDGHTHFFCSEHCRATFVARASGHEQAHDGGHADDHDHAAQHGRV